MCYVVVLCGDWRAGDSVCVFLCQTGVEGEVRPRESSSVILCRSPSPHCTALSTLSVEEMENFQSGLIDTEVIEFNISEGQTLLNSSQDLTTSSLNKSTLLREEIGMDFFCCYGEINLFEIF